MKILLADDEKTVRVTLTDALKGAGHEVVAVENGTEALTATERQSFDCLITDIRMPGLDGMELIRRVQPKNPDIYILVITAYASVERAVEAMKAGANEFIPKPFDNDAVIIRLQKIEEQLSKSRRLQEELTGRYRFDRLLGRSKKMIEVYELVEAVAPGDTTVLVVGESGTGKELVANALHHNSPRKDREMVKMSCANFPETLIEDELFGHEKGAFTDARDSKTGRFERAHGSSIFIDDIDDLTPTVQVKFLRVLQERELERLGGTKTIKVDVRLIAATKVDLYSLVQLGKFREDVFYRLNVVVINLPPLREREGDIPLLVGHFIQLYAKGKHYEVAPETMEALEAYPWPGNVRELEAAVQRAIALSGTANYLKKENLLRPKVETQIRKDRRTLKEVVAEAEREHIRSVLALTGNHKGEAAAILGISRKNLWEKLKEYDLDGDR